jgi:hypothetical protein
MVFRANLLQMDKRRAKCENFTDEHCTLLEKMLRQPLYSVIDMLRLARGSYPNENGKPLPKRRCLELYSGEFPEGFAEEAFAVMDMRDKYRAFLLESNFKSPNQYISLLREINAIYQPAREVIVGNLRILKNKYKV